jgi:chemosensory pili system protein ChpA (sensor histidine kinase/response regulator)
MQPEQKQRIVFYFIEEASEHLRTIEQGLLDLQATIANPESLTEVYRAAHSVKGGAAMLGLSGIQRTAHCLEDGFKALKEDSIQVDGHLEALLGRVLHFLQALLEQLQISPETFEATTSASMVQIDPALAELRSYVRRLLSPEEFADQELTTTLGLDSELDIEALSLSEEDNIAAVEPEPADAEAGEQVENQSRELEVGSVELGSLANLFGGEGIADVDLVWQQEGVASETGVDQLDSWMVELEASQNEGSSEVSGWVASQTDERSHESLSNPEAFADLEDLLGGELGDNLTQDVSVDDLSSFLERLVEEESSGLSASGATSEAIVVPDELSIAENFTNLDDLISQESSLNSSPSSVSAAVPMSADFSDLEKLLEDTDQLGGRSATPSRPQQTASSRGGRSGSGPRSEATMRVPIKQLDSLNNLVGELVVNRNSLEQDQERLRQFLDNLLYQVQQINDAGQRMRDLYERSLLEISLVASRRNPSTISSAPSGSSRTSVQSTSSIGLALDALEMDRFSGFHLLAQEMIEQIVRIRESSSDIEFVVDEMEQVSRMFRQTTTQLQENLTRSRMIPFAQIADRLPRAVRDISIKCGKQAELVVEGRDTLIDKMILEQLYDPMTHLVNNAIAHGIESPEVRQASGKPVLGRIIMRVFHQGNQTIISVSDDGAGIDPIQVKAKAIQRGLLNPAQAEALSQVDVYDLLFQPGFSTRDQADDFAGRGVGMDVVRTSLTEIRGDIITDSTLGRGTTFTIRLPLTLSISKALCCVSNYSQIAFPMDGVEDVVDISAEEVQIDAEGHSCISWRDELLPFRPLGELLRFNRQLGRGSIYGTNQEEDALSIVILRSGGNILALQVDQVLGEREIVIKQLEGPAPKPIGVAGATVQGDGKVMAIADVLELIELGMGRVRRDVSQFLWDHKAGQIEEAPAKTEPMVLIVDDSITVRELLSMTFSKVGYRVEQARDGQEAWDKLRAGLPCDLIFCDIEMPRMDGLELLSRVQKDAHLSHLPIAMLTSRGAERHRQLAAQLGATGYFTKPYLEEALLDAAQRMLKGEVLLAASSAAPAS